MEIVFFLLEIVGDENKDKYWIGFNGNEKDNGL